VTPDALAARKRYRLSAMRSEARDCGLMRRAGLRVPAKSYFRWLSLL
jgi:hypothetical protein